MLDLDINKLPAMALAMLILLTIMISVLAGGGADMPALPAQTEKQPHTYTTRQILARKPVSSAKPLTEDVPSTYSPFTYKYYFHNSAKNGTTCAYGIDVSSRQGAVNWFLCRDDGVEFAFLRAGSRGYSEGGMFEDAAFDANIACANAVGVKVGAYYYSQATNVEEILQEADVLLRRVSGHRIDLPLVLDFEYADVEGRVGGRLYDAKLSVEDATEMCLAFCERIRSAGYQPAVYANTSMLNKQLDAARLAQECDIWVAYPGIENPYGGEYTYWQYTWQGRVDGIAGAVDCNFWYR
ncbi:MAG: hypothetical protein E7559_05105 [Ruminococcaceae bacterium]|nr:hypothetical protein [Oscillospiraceae bacterium]